MCEFFYLRFIGKIIKRLTQVTVVPQSPSNFLDVPTCVKLLCERTLENSAKVLRGYCQRNLTRFDPNTQPGAYSIDVFLCNLRPNGKMILRIFPNFCVIIYGQF